MCIHLNNDRLIHCSPILIFLSLLLSKDCSCSNTLITFCIDILNPLRKSCSWELLLCFFLTKAKASWPLNVHNSFNLSLSHRFKCRCQFMRCPYSEQSVWLKLPKLLKLQPFLPEQWSMNKVILIFLCWYLDTKPESVGFVLHFCYFCYIHHKA